MAEEYRAERWVYMGRRFQSGKLFYCWRDEAGEDLLFSSKFKARIIGGTHVVIVEYDAGPGGRRVRRDAPWDSSVPAHEDAPMWSAEDRGAAAALELERAIKRQEEKGPAFQELTLRQARDVLRKQFGPRYNGTLAAYIQYLNS